MTLTFDLETTSANIQDARICQIALITDDGIQINQLINPGVPIETGATEVHGITDAMVKDAPSFKSYWGNIKDLFTNAGAIAGFNIKHFDMPILSNELKRIGCDDVEWDSKAILDYFVLESRLHPRDLNALHKKYTGVNFENAHDALADVQATIRLGAAMFEYHKDVLPTDLANWNDFLWPKNPNYVDREGKVRFVNDEPVLTFGKHKSKSLQWLAVNDRIYLTFIASNFGGEMAEIAKNALKGLFPQRP